MFEDTRHSTVHNRAAGTAEGMVETEHLQTLLKAGALQNAILNSANFSSIATDEKGVIQIFNIGAERMLGYKAADVLNKLTPADIFDPQEVIARAFALSAELKTEIRPGFEALVFKASRGIEDICERTYIRKDGTRLPVIVSVTALRDELEAVIGYLLISTDNTARKEAELERQRLLDIQEEMHKQLQQSNTTLQISEERLAVTLKSIGDAVITTDADARVTLLNPLAEKLTGWTTAEALGRSVDEIFHIINSETLQRAAVPVRETLAHGTVQGMANHTIVIARHGNECAIADSCAPIRDREGHVIGAVLVFRDVTEEYLVQQNLRDNAALVQTILNTVVDGIITFVASTGIVETVNPAAEKMFGYSSAELIGHDFNVLVPEIDRDQHHAYLEYYQTDEDAAGSGPGRQVLGIRKGGSTFAMEMAVSEMWLRGQRYFTCILRDITERNQMDKLVQRNNRELKKAKATADKANLAKSDFLSRMSHELRTPLNAILGFSQLLEVGSPSLTVSQTERLHQITKAGWYLLELINEILDLAVIESGKLSLSREPVSLIDVMHECKSMVETPAQKHHIRLEFLPFDHTWFANADRTRTKQVLVILLTNAIKYNSENGTVVVECSSGTPEIVRISIKDNGAGLSAKKQEQLFQPFNRLGQENGTEEGTGMGLVVAKQLVELMGGNIGVNSVVGKGSEFWIELVRCIPPQQAAEKLPGANTAATPQDARPCTLLYVEDNPANMLLVEQIIKDRTNVKILGAHYGQLGIELARTHLPDVILLDINLPDISGIEILKILSKDTATRHIPVLALSANAMQIDIDRGLEAGFFRYLTKPIRVNEFLNALDEALKVSNPEQPSQAQQEAENDK